MCSIILCGCSVKELTSEQKERMERNRLAHSTYRGKVWMINKLEEMDKKLDKLIEKSGG